MLPVNHRLVPAPSQMMMLQAALKALGAASSDTHWICSAVPALPGKTRRLAQAFLKPHPLGTRITVAHKPVGVTMLDALQIAPISS